MRVCFVYFKWSLVKNNHTDESYSSLLARQDRDDSLSSRRVQRKFVARNEMKRKGRIGSHV